MPTPLPCQHAGKSCAAISLTFAFEVARRLTLVASEAKELSAHELAVRLVETIGHGDPIDVGVYAALLHHRGVKEDALASLALRPMLDLIRTETARIEKAQRDAELAEPYGYWKDGEWYGYHPEEEALNVGERRTLTPVWTKNQAVTFVGVAVEGSDEVVAQPETEEDAAGLRRYIEAKD